MSGIHYQQIDEPCAWRGAGLGKADFSIALQPEELAQIDRVLAKVEGRDVETLERTDFDTALLWGLADRIRAELQTGRGVAVITGCAGRGYSADQLTAIYWGLGTLMGKPQTQSIFGERIAHVRREDDNPTNRGYRSDRELTMHTDTTDIAGLLCLQSAKSGGVSQFVSAMALHNEIAANRPDLLPALYAGFNWHLGGEQNPGDPDITAYPIPIFANVDGKVCSRYLPGLLVKAATQMGGLPPDLKAAMDYLDALGRREDLMVQFTLEPGEMVFFNNFVVYHARTAFEDHPEPERRRDLMRLWLEVPGLRAYPPQMDPYQGGGIKKQPEKLRQLQAAG